MNKNINISTKNNLLLFAAVVSMALFLNSCTETPADFEELPSAGSISGKVSNSAGTGLIGASVTTNPVTSAVTTNSSGNYSIPNVKPGDYTVTASLNGYLTNSADVIVKAGKNSSGNITLSISATTGTIIGKISNASGEGLSGAKVTTSPPTATVTTNSAGEYSILNVIPGNYTVSASLVGYVTNSASVTVQAGQTVTGNITLPDFVCGYHGIVYSGKTYNTVPIGSQCWLRENLDAGQMIMGSKNPSDNDTIEKYCYDNNFVNCSIYGGLYQWNEAMGYSAVAGARGICPEGWHIPTMAEFDTLAASAGHNGNALKALGQGSGSGAGTNALGFSALLAGVRYPDGTFGEFMTGARFWTSDQFTLQNAHLFNIDYNNANLYINQTDKQVGFSIRCIRD